MRSLLAFKLGAWVGIAIAAAFVKRSMPSRGDEESDELALVAVFDGIDLKSRAGAFRGGSMLAWFGGIALDLREAQLAPGARLSLRTFCGGVAIRTPPEWRQQRQRLGESRCPGAHDRRARLARRRGGGGRRLPVELERRAGRAVETLNGVLVVRHVETPSLVRVVPVAPALEAAQHLGCLHALFHVDLFGRSTPQPPRQRDGSASASAILRGPAEKWPSG
jgi:hypothetical protein